MATQLSRGRLINGSSRDNHAAYSVLERDRQHLRMAAGCGVVVLSLYAKRTVDYGLYRKKTASS